MSLTGGIAEPRAREGWLAWLAAVAFVVLFASFGGTAFASDCPTGMSAHDGASAAPCCSGTNCIAGACVASVAHHDCDLADHSTAIQPSAAGNRKKSCTQTIVSALPAPVVSLANLAQRPPLRARPVGIARYVDTYARTGRLLI